MIALRTNTDFGSSLRGLRRSLGFKLKDMTDVVKLSTLASYEHGTICPSHTNFNKLMNHYGYKLVIKHKVTGESKSFKGDARALLRRARQDKNYTRTDLEVIYGISDSTIRGWETLGRDIRMLDFVGILEVLDLEMTLIRQTVGEYA